MVEWACMAVVPLGNETKTNHTAHPQTNLSHKAAWPHLGQALRTQNRAQNRMLAKQNIRSLHDTMSHAGAMSKRAHLLCYAQQPTLSSKLTRTSWHAIWRARSSRSKYQTCMNRPSSRPSPSPRGRSCTGHGPLSAVLRDTLPPSSSSSEE